MAKYGLFSGSNANPDQTFAGDSMAQDKDHVDIYQTQPGKTGRGPQVAAVKLGDGQSVKKIEE